MTIPVDLICASQILIDPYRPRFIDWANKFQNLIFAYTEDKEPAFSKAYLLAKRIPGETIQSLMLMNPEDLDELYNLEKQLIEHEKKEAAKTDNH